MARGSWISAILLLFIGRVNAAEEHTKIPLPSYHYGARIPVSCLNRSM
jgi:hypothetical protein